jgi:hypothetical protein
VTTDPHIRFFEYKQVDNEKRASVVHWFATGHIIVGQFLTAAPTRLITNRPRAPRRNWSADLFHRLRS